jgi:hypothetical protein
MSAEWGLYVLVSGICRFVAMMIPWGESCECFRALCRWKKIEEGSFILNPVMRAHRTHAAVSRPWPQLCSVGRVGYLEQDWD